MHSANKAVREKYLKESVRVVVKECHVTLVSGYITHWTYDKDSEFYSLLKLLPLRVLSEFEEGELVPLIEGYGPIEMEMYHCLSFINKDGTVTSIGIEFDDQWEWFGKWYGYDTCCIEYFKGHTLMETDSHFEGTGLITCPKCSQEQPNKVLAKISSMRICPLTFNSEKEEPTGEVLILKFLLGIDY